VAIIYTSVSISWLFFYSEKVMYAPMGLFIVKKQRNRRRREIFDSNSKWEKTQGKVDITNVAA